MDLFFFVHQDMKARIDRNMEDVKTLSTKPDSVISTLNGKMKSKLGSYVIKSFRIDEAEWSALPTLYDNTISETDFQLPKEVGAWIKVNGKIKGPAGVFYFMISSTKMNEETAYEKMKSGSNDVLVTSENGIIFFSKKYFAANSNFNITSPAKHIRSGGKYFYYYFTTNLAPSSIMNKTSPVIIDGFELPGLNAILLKKISFAFMTLIFFIFSL